MAQRLADGSIQMADGRIVYANSVIIAADLLEILPLVTPPPAWPFVSGGGGGGSGSGPGTPGARGADGAPGPAGAPGSQGPQGTNPGVQGPQGNIGSQGNQGLAGTGAQGNQGIAGAGTQGFQGFGFQGLQGNQGLTGAGVQGNQGITGVQGPQGSGSGGGSDPTYAVKGVYLSDRSSVRVGAARTVDLNNLRLFGCIKTPAGQPDLTFNTCFTNSPFGTLTFQQSVDAVAADYDVDLGQCSQLTVGGFARVYRFVGTAPAKWWTRRWFPFLHTPLKIKTSLTNVRVWVGFFSANPGGSDTIPLNSMGFRFSQGVDTNFQCITKDGTTENVQDSGVAVAADTLYTFEIRTLNNGDIEFYINQTLVATSSANLPDLDQSFADTAGISFMAKAGTVLFQCCDLYVSAD